MPKKKKKGKDRGFYIPDAGEPHLHVHKGGVTYTPVGHNHRYLTRGSLIYYGSVNATVAELEDAGDERSLEIRDYIRDNIL
jgi:hypothetical protein